jgi:hypothetical protein
MQELDPCRKLAEDTRRVGKPRLGRIESVEQYLKNTGMRNWKQQSQDREEWRTILEEAKDDQQL